MGYIKRFLVVTCLLSLAGCSTLGFKDRTFEEGYRTGVRENVLSFAKNFHGNDFPYFYWESPIVQDVHIPSHIENGMFIPEHNEPVMIEPGEWRNKFSYPIACGKKDKNKEDGNYADSTSDFSVRDITVMPGSFTCDDPRREDADSRK